MRILPGAGKERMFERSEFLAPAANGFIRIAPKTPALDFSFVTFLCIKTLFLNSKINNVLSEAKGKVNAITDTARRVPTSGGIRGRNALRPYTPT